MGISTKSFFGCAGFLSALFATEKKLKKISPVKNISRMALFLSRLQLTPSKSSTKRSLAMGAVMFWAEQESQMNCQLLSSLKPATRKTRTSFRLLFIKIYDTRIHNCRSNIPKTCDVFEQKFCCKTLKQI